MELPFSPRPAPNTRQTEIFLDRQSYAAFPHLIRLEGDELLLAFRQAPVVEGLRHTHPRSIITVIRSPDRGESWDIEAASQLAAGGGQELGLIYLGNGRVGGALAAHEIVHGHETQRSGFSASFQYEYPWIGGKPNTEAAPFAYANVGALWCWSNNYGLTWRLENAILVADRMQACAPPVQLEDGTLMIPAYGPLEPSEVPSAMLYRSTDEGKSWSEAVVIARGRPQERDYNEPALLEVEPGHLLCMLRIMIDDQYPRRMFRQNESFDNGVTWSPSVPTLVESGACPRLLKLHDGRLLLTYGRRLEPYGIYASLSEDDGKTWGDTNWLLRQTPDGDQGYTSSLELDAGRIFTTSYAKNADGVTGIIGTFWDLP